MSSLAQDSSNRQSSKKSSKISWCTPKNENFCRTERELLLMNAPVSHEKMTAQTLNYGQGVVYEPTNNNLSQILS
jgi:hypothetical protein